MRCGARRAGAPADLANGKGLRMRRFVFVLAGLAARHLVLQFTYNTRREIGGAAYVDAYWRGRYYGFIDDAAAAAPWKE